MYFSAQAFTTCDALPKCIARHHTKKIDGGNFEPECVIRLPVASLNYHIDGLAIVDIFL